MPRSFLVKKKERKLKLVDGLSLNRELFKRREDERSLMFEDRPPVVVEPLLSAWAPFVPLVQPLAVRVSNGEYIEELLYVPYALCTLTNYIFCET